jgi:hypothetical protein
MKSMTENQNGDELKPIAVPESVKKKLDEHKVNQWEPYHAVITRLMSFYDEHKEEATA